MTVVYVRLLQVVWFLSIIIVLVTLFRMVETYQSDVFYEFYEKVEGYQKLANITGLWGAFLLVVQYLVFASWSPLDLLTGALIKKDN